MAPRRDPIDPLLRARRGGPAPEHLAPPRSTNKPADAARGGQTARRHAARQARAGALAISCLSTVGLAYIFAGRDRAGAGVGTLGALGPQATDTPVPAPPAPPSTAPAIGPAAPPATAAGTATGAPSSQAPATAAKPAATTTASYQGAVAPTPYGPLQVQAKVRSGRLIDVVIEQYPNDRNRSVIINEYALPELRTEALSAQTANIDAVSGATYTSAGFARSLQSALLQAKAAGAVA